MNKLRLAVCFLIARGYIWDDFYVSWVHPTPEHWQPTEGELEAARITDNFGTYQEFLAEIKEAQP